MNLWCMQRRAEGEETKTTMLTSKHLDVEEEGGRINLVEMYL